MDFLHQHMLVIVLVSLGVLALGAGALASRAGFRISRKSMKKQQHRGRLKRSHRY